MASTRSRLAGQGLWACGSIRSMGELLPCPRPPDLGIFLPRQGKRLRLFAELHEG